MEREVFPGLAEELLAAGEVYVDHDYMSHFAHYLMRRRHDLWQRTEQEVGITDDLKARFFLTDP